MVACANFSGRIESTDQRVSHLGWVFGPDGSHNPSLDPVVHVEAGRLRSKLAEYLTNLRTGHTLVVDLPRGDPCSDLPYFPTFPARKPTIEIGHPKVDLGIGKWPEISAKFRVAGFRVGCF